MTFFSGLLTSLFEMRYLRGNSDSSRPISDLARALLGSSGEVSGSHLARMILDSYQNLNIEEKSDFFLFLYHELGLDIAAVRTALDRWETKPERRQYAQFMTAAEPARIELIRRLNEVPGATEKLVAMRKDLLSLRKQYPELAVLDWDFHHLLASWFNRGFLVLRPIDWETPAHILEKIIAYEAVHSIESWDDLRRRIQPEDRRCLAFFHPSMPNEPLIFVEVALGRGTPSSVQKLLAEERTVLPAHQADTAVFYSISNCQAGLAGISFGNSLIKQVVNDLSRQLSGLNTFITLSPIPKLNQWLYQQGIDPEQVRTEDWPAYAAQYLLHAKGKNGAPLDPVARFHLGNGALIHALHAEADTSTNGRRQSGGTMVNYLYDEKSISANHENYANDYQIAASNTVVQLAGAPSNA